MKLAPSTVEPGRRSIPRLRGKLRRRLADWVRKPGAGRKQEGVAAHRDRLILQSEIAGIVRGDGEAAQGKRVSGLGPGCVGSPATARKPGEEIGPERADGFGPWAGSIETTTWLRHGSPGPRSQSVASRRPVALSRRATFSPRSISDCPGRRSLPGRRGFPRRAGTPECGGWAIHRTGEKRMISPTAENNPPWAARFLNAEGNRMSAECPRRPKLGWREPGRPRRRARSGSPGPESRAMRDRARPPGSPLRSNVPAAPIRKSVSPIVSGRQSVRESVARKTSAQRAIPSREHRTADAGHPCEDAEDQCGGAEREPIQARALSPRSGRTSSRTTSA